jgi:phosphohistidine phosphatase
MEIIVLRHAPAEDRKDWARRGKADSARPLTAQGRRRARSAAAGLAALVGSADVVATSPWKRALQTAEPVARALNARLVEAPLLTPGRAPGELARWVAGLHEARVVLVGHEPHLSGVVSWILTGKAAPPVLALKKGQAVLLDAPAAVRGAALIWSLPPGALKRAAKKGGRA